jgi:hypothetical protein
VKRALPRVVAQGLCLIHSHRVRNVEAEVPPRAVGEVHPGRKVAICCHVRQVVAARACVSSAQGECIACAGRISACVCVEVASDLNSNDYKQTSKASECKSS